MKLPSRKKQIQNPFSFILIRLVFLVLPTHAFVEMSSTTAHPRKIAIIGTTGLLGRETIIQLASRGILTRCLLRHSISSTCKPSIEKSASKDQIASYLSRLPGVEMIQGDITDVQSLQSLLEGCTSCIAVHGATRRTKVWDFLPFYDPERNSGHAKKVNYEGVKNLVEVVGGSPTCERIVRITGKGENPWSFFSILINLLGSMAKAWNYEGEELLRQSNVDYTIIRPGIMTTSLSSASNSRVLALADNGGSLTVSPVSYAAIAGLCIGTLDHNNTKRSTLCAMNVEEGKGEASYTPLLKKVRPDTREFAKSLMKEHLKAVRTGGVILAALGCLGLGGIWGAIKVLGGLILNLRETLM